MKVEYINPFLDSAKLVFEQMIQVSPDRGDLEIRELINVEDHLWIKIGVKGEMNGHVYLGIEEEVALRLVSVMMGGFTVTELDDMSKSAISEIGNMISGNASTILYEKGIGVDITPPQLLSSRDHTYNGQVLSVPLMLSSIGRIDLQVAII